MIFLPTVTTFLQDYYQPLLILHAVAAIVSTGGATHLFVAYVTLVRKKVLQKKRLKLFSTITLVSYLICFIDGLLIYPTYRFWVRALDFDLEGTGHPLISGLFDIKENWAFVALVMVFALFALSRVVSSDGKHSRLIPVSALVATLLCIILWFNVISGLVIASFGSYHEGYQILLPE
ncbi:MAG: hypothetical protein NUW37_19465 [Planctomycetes bacterium]|nr:hypothetical protein [Planctomycetota bacterium]